MYLYLCIYIYIYIVANFPKLKQRRCFLKYGYVVLFAVRCGNDYVMSRCATGDRTEKDS